MTAEDKQLEKQIDGLIARGREAMRNFQNEDQEGLDMAVRALAWAIYKPGNAHLLAKMAVQDTGLGNVASKVTKNTRKTFGTLRDLLRVKTTGIIEDNPDKGIIKFGKPVGVVGAVCPSTNPSATPANKAMMAVKGGNAVIIAPSPAGYGTSAKTVEFMRKELAKAGYPKDLVQVLAHPVTKNATQKLIEKVDLAVVTGSQNNVTRAMQSGTVSIGVGPGNVPVIIDDTADLEDAAEKVTKSKIFDNATSCSSENALVILTNVYDQMVQSLRSEGGWLCTLEQKTKVQEKLWLNGILNRNVIAKDAHIAAEVFGLPSEAYKSKFFMVEETEVAGKGSFADEKLSLVLTLYRAANFDDALRITSEILDVRGKGHSVGIHTANFENANKVAQTTDVVRVLVNQAHTFGNGGGFDNSLPFTLSMGGGTWAGNTISDNLNYKHFINITHLVTTIEPDKPKEKELFGPLWKKCGDV